MHLNVARSSIRGLMAALVLGFSLGASAQAPTERFNVNRFTPAPGPGNYLATEGAQVGGHLQPSAGLTLDYAHRPFSLRSVDCDAGGTNCEVATESTNLVSYLAQANLWATISLLDALQIGINLPLAISDGDTFNRTTSGGQPISVPGGSRFVLSDPTLSLKARLLGHGEGFNLAVSVFGTFPVGNIIDEDSFLGDESLRIGGNLISQFVANGFHLAVNLGGFFRPERQFLSTRAASQLTYRAAVGYDVTPLITVYGEVDGASGFSSELDEHSLEGRLGANYRVGDFSIGLAGGAGIIAGVGTPVFRGLAAFSYQPVRGDRDGDGIDDAADACPSEREDQDGWEDEDGCPEADNDLDNLPDADDPCPNEAEDFDGFEDEDGCPDTDNDGDGISDGFDGCPSVAEDMDNDRDEDGCPDNDSDRDGIDDVDDHCPQQPEDPDGFGDEDGCPEEDFDQDGIIDDMDECADVPEVINGIEDEDGCPEEDADADGIVDAQDRCPNRPETLNGTRDDDGCPDGEALVRVDPDRIELLQPIQFRSNRARIRNRSDRVLGAIASVLRINGHFRHVRVEVVATAGDDEASRALSQQRADAVVAALVERGIDASRFNAVGAGRGTPNAEGETPADGVVLHLEHHGGAEATNPDAATNRVSEQPSEGE